MSSISAFNSSNHPGDFSSSDGISLCGVSSIPESLVSDSREFNSSFWIIGTCSSSVSISLLCPMPPTSSEGCADLSIFESQAGISLDVSPATGCSSRISFSSVSNHSGISVFRFSGCLLSGLTFVVETFCNQSGNSAGSISSALLSDERGGCLSSSSPSDDAHPASFIQSGISLSL